MEVLQWGLVPRHIELPVSAMPQWVMAHRATEWRSWPGYWESQAGRPAGFLQRVRGWALHAARVLATRYVVVSFLFLPSIVAGIYFFLVAADRYESEARFVVRSAAKPESGNAKSFLTQLGFSRSQDDSFIVQDFLTSRDAAAQLRARLPLLEIYGRPGADFIARYPSFLFGRTDEEFHKYLQFAISAVHLDKTGITTLRVQAFRADDAYEVTRTLLDLAEGLVNRINARIQSDSVGNAMAQLQIAEKRVIESQAALTDFRNRELVLDPTMNAVALSELISRLSAELAATRAQITEMQSGSAASPQLIALQRRAAALQEQVKRERERITSNSDGLADRIAAYERLGLEHEFAKRMVSSAEAELTRARAEATRQLLYLERIVEPQKADYSIQPKRVRIFLTVLFANLLLVLVGWLIVSGIREHASLHD